MGDVVVDPLDENLDRTERAAYLENKNDYLDYPAFLATGRPVASGLIEGVARWLIKDRMEVTGARWGLDSAEAVLRLRALRGNGDLDDYLGYHFQQENTAPRQPLSADLRSRGMTTRKPVADAYLA